MYGYTFASNKERTDAVSGVQSGLCREDNQVSSKFGAHLILRSMLGFDVDPDTIPQQHERIGAFQTVVEATYIRPVDGTEVEREAA
jgi:DEAD/DEAH box helicase domain-containing protein